MDDCNNAIDTSEDEYSLCNIHIHAQPFLRLCYCPAVYYNIPSCPLLRYRYHTHTKYDNPSFAHSFLNAATIKKNNVHPASNARSKLPKHCIRLANVNNVAEDAAAANDIKKTLQIGQIYSINYHEIEEVLTNFFPCTSFEKQKLAKYNRTKKDSKIYSNMWNCLLFSQIDSLTPLVVVVCAVKCWIFCCALLPFHRILLHSLFLKCNLFPFKLLSGTLQTKLQ